MLRLSASAPSFSDSNGKQGETTLKETASSDLDPSVCDQHRDVRPNFVTFLSSFFNTQQNKHWKQGLLVAGQMVRGHVSFLFHLFVAYFLPFSTALVLFDLELLLPGLVQVNQSLVVEDEENEVQCVRGDADDAEVLEDKVEDVAQVERTHHRQDGRRHENQGSHRTDGHS